MRAHPILLLVVAWALVAGQAVASSHTQEARDWAYRQAQEDQRRRQEQFDREKQSYGKTITGSGEAATPSNSGGGIPGDLRPLRAQLERQPALPSGKNPLLGRWATPDGQQPTYAGLAGQVESLLGATACSMLLGAGPLEFRPTTLVNASGQAPLGAVKYRAGRGSSLFVLPQRGPVVLIHVEMQGRDRATLKAGSGCTLARIGASAGAPADSGRAAPVATRAPVPANATASATASTQATGVFSGAAFRCADGYLYHVTGCRGDVCDLTEWHLPVVTRFPPMSVKPVAQIAEQVKACEAGGLRYGADNKPYFVQ